MACILNTSHSLDCRTSIGGLKKIFLASVTGGTEGISASATAGVVSSFSVDGTSVSASSGLEATPFVVIEVPVETAGFTEVATYSNENGTSFYTTTLSFPVNKMDSSSQELLRVIGQNNRLCAVVLDNNDNYFLLSNERGVIATASNGGSGTSYSDRSGYVVELTGVALDPCYEVVFA